MYRNFVSSTKLALIAAVVLLAIPGTSEAQRGGRGGGGGGGGGGRGYGGGGYYGGGFYGDRGFGYGGGFGLGLGLGLGYPYYGGGYYYGDPGYSVGPTYYDNGVFPATSTYNSFYPPDTSSPMSTSKPAMVEVQVPPDAEILFEGQKTNQTGSFRQFQSPPLEPGSKYSYTVTAKWMSNGQPMTQERTVPVAPGMRSFVSFLQPAPTNQQGQPQQLPQPKAGDINKQPDK
jgi:uncharacterized protein (TIGR03000 family)